MAYIQNGIGYTLKCDKCGTLLHRKGKDKPFLSLDILYCINGITPERVIRTAFKWCLDKGLITNPIYIK